MKSLSVLLLVAACADPVVDMQLILPKTADRLDTTCITAVEVRVTGTKYLTDSNDLQRECIEITAGSSYEAIREAIRGKFDLKIPDSGMSGVEIYGWSGPNACKDDGLPYVSPDLLFFGRGDYIGQDRLDIPVVPNLSCSHSDVKVRLLDMFALVGGASCQAAGTLTNAGAGIGTLVPRLWGKGTEWYGNLTGATATGNLAAFSGPATTGAKSCLAIDGGADSGGSTGCVVTGGASVCAGAGEYEHAIVNAAVLGNAGNYDAQLMTKFPGIVWGSVWSSGTTKTPLAGAQVTVDPAHGKVIYVDPPNAQGQIIQRTSQDGTGPSGMFALYTDTLASVKITSGATSRTVMLGATDDRDAAAIIVMGP